MGAIATLTSKGQITIPKAIRERLGLRTGDRVLFVPRDDGTIVVQAATVDLTSLAGSLKPPPGVHFTSEQLSDIAVEAAVEEFKRSVR